MLLNSSCDFFKDPTDDQPIARVNEAYLYKRDLEGLVKEGTSKDDSTVIVNNFITKWATQLLLLDGAERNLPEARQIEFDKLVKQYKSDLYSKSYLEALVNRSVDTVINDAEAQLVYETNLATFKLNEDLVKFRYLVLNEKASNNDEIEERFKRFDAEDKNYLDSISIQFKDYWLKDSLWVKKTQMVDRIPVLNAENKSELLKKTNYIQLKDSLNLYLMQIKDVLSQNDLAPLEYVRPTIKQIVVNKRKLELIKTFEKDITKDAIKNKRFEIYN
ncbi:peptidyl-prolyl cis-trans isomerase [Subsaximicrobium wynnwilliamsii]|uniref:peptidyl-prolyl cis-trans isomerase n=1 Tax=Subsaximicrobium wynnwilliamsii TaxID=291179 RepID=UPI002938F0F8|nr:peptidyl-prolyl cis-trans isomerase [Subsaximicrobium wynnwilliamsii]